MEQLEAFKLVGIETRTTNENGASASALGKLWERFYGEQIPGKIPNKESNEVYTIYTDYASDYKGAYTAVIGLKVSTLDQVPDGLIGREFQGGTYQKFTAKGPMPDAVVESWKEIWEKDSELNRKYTADFEVYGEKAQNGADSEVEIYIAIK